MYLKRLEIGGFKSFAAKTVLNLEPGITAIVGPNGSGKSNIADAIRWSLGEQSGKQLRLKKSHELVFAGTEKKARAGLAEVSLLLDNSDGLAELDFSEVELSRRLYRSGETEYLLNRRKVRLNEVQQLLAAAGFGANSYSVIGQGVIDTFVLASPAERKLLFDEAAGIHQYEIKREQSLRKMEATKDNLSRVKDILAELAPRLASLSRQVEATKTRQDVAKRLQQARAELISVANKDSAQQQSALQKAVKELTDQVKRLTNDVKQLEQQKLTMAKQAQSRDQERAKSTEQLRQLEVERDQLVVQLSAKKAEVQLLVERNEANSGLAETIENIRTSQLKLDQEQKTVQQLLVSAKKIETETQSAMDACAAEIASSQAKLSKLRRETDPSDRQAFIDHALAVLKLAAQEMAEAVVDQERLKLLVHKAGRLLAGAAKGQTETLAELKQMQMQLNQLLKRRDIAHDGYTKAVIKVRSLELDIIHLTTQAATLQAQLTDASQRMTEEGLPVVVLRQRQAQLVKDETALGRLDERLAALRRVSASEEVGADSASVFALAAKLEAARSELQQAHAHLEQADHTRAQLAASEQHYASLAKQWFDGQVPPASATAELATLEREVDILQSKLEAYGEDNRELNEEFAEVSKRHEFLSSQVTDLETAQADVAKVVAQLEQLIRAKFESGFAEIAKYFNQYFQQLFGGGRAELVLNN
ncbi:MAG TPA: AAA family ATPase, partial [Candidatus Nanoarchaeia archaeon]|nr:AAA family ATPase [Candidatus Nanoarchaeia archaeon]